MRSLLLGTMCLSLTLGAQAARAEVGNVALGYTPYGVPFSPVPGTFYRRGRGILVRVRNDTSPVGGALPSRYGCVGFVPGCTALVYGYGSRQGSRFGYRRYAGRFSVHRHLAHRYLAYHRAIHFAGYTASSENITPYIPGRMPVHGSYVPTY